MLSYFRVYFDIGTIRTFTPLHCLQYNLCIGVSCVCMCGVWIGSDPRAHTPTQLDDGSMHTECECKNVSAFNRWTHVCTTDRHD